MTMIVAGATTRLEWWCMGRMMRSGRSECIMYVVTLRWYVMRSAYHQSFIMARRRCYSHFWTSKRRKATAFKAGEWRRRCKEQELVHQPVKWLTDEERLVFVEHWPTSVQWPYGRQPIATCLTETEALLEL